MAEHDEEEAEDSDGAQGNQDPNDETTCIMH
eukprot:CAMPEP_0194490124 /NCGR_PEP_ID=MMETSP0253-20130528/9446_1 /TAXON_ID=2966 /ORGANISM="Noctiluca scintillans" /LENGTH=30 /DNA_ID= /DNA_START= /DNA_END= /DNA_ORIENTATION=